MAWETMAWAKRARTGTATRKAVLMALAEYADERHSCFPSQERLAGDTELSVATVRRSLRWLERAGMIATERRPGDGKGRQPNRYVLNVAEGQEVTMTSSPGATGQPEGGKRSSGDLQTPLEHQTDSDPPTPHEDAATPSTQFPTPARIRLGDSYPDAFTEFWDAYPRHVDKLAAYKAWLARIAEARGAGISVARRIMAMTVAAQSYAAAVSGRSLEHVKHPATFLGPSEPWREYARGNPDLRSVAGDSEPRRFT